MDYLRLRQVCLVSADIAGECARVKASLGLEECYRDPNVAKYGLENVLFPVGSSFIEIVAPTRPGTAAGRFLERHGGRYGYMIILDCDDPERRQAHAASLGVRTANLIRHGDYLGVQLHPKDTGAAMIELNHTVGGEDPMGPYAPAGPDWRRAIRGGVMRAVEIECPEPEALAVSWGRLFQKEIKKTGNSEYKIDLDAGEIRFLPASGPEPVFAGVVLEAASPAVLELCGVRFSSEVG